MDGMNDTVGFCELCLCWFAANYAVCDDPVCDKPAGWPARKELISRWSIWVLLRSAAGAIVWFGLARWSSVGAGGSALLLVALVLTPWVRRQFVTVHRLVEFELLGNGLFLLLIWTWKSLWAGTGVAF